MYLIISLILSLIFVLVLNEQIKKYSNIFYLLATILTICICFYYQFNLKDVFPSWFTKYIINIFKRGAFPTALFIIVMYTAILNKKWIITKKFYKVRGEIAIIASIITLGHNFVYGFTGKKHFINLFANLQETELKYIIAKIISLVMIFMMIPLMITSFKSVRKNMDYYLWKKIQKMAYPFFILIYVHTMVLFLSKIQDKLLDIILYSIIFISYIILRIGKAIKEKNKN